MVSKINYFLLFILISGVMATSCVNDKPNEETEQIEEILKAEIDSTASTLVKYNNTLFSIPSPYQIGFLIKKQGLDYNSEYLNPTENASKYSENFTKALNLGVYGADLGYLNIYEQNSEAIKYFSTVKKLAQDLGVSGAFNPSTIKRIENNMGNKDSLLYILSNTYRDADRYLKENNREDIGVLILAGGWIESLNLMTEIVKINRKQEIINRIGEQKQPLDNLIKILSPYYNQSEHYSKLVDGFIDLAYEFDGIKVDYSFEEPTVDPENRITTINGSTKIVISDEQLKTISSKVTTIRKQIIEQ